MQYTSSNAWTHSVEIESSDNLDRTKSAAILSNGKIALVTSFESHAMQQTLITVEQQYTNGVYRPNIIESFDTSCLCLFSLNGMDTNMRIISQELDFFSGIFTTSSMITDKLSGVSVTLLTNMFTPKQCPFTSIQSAIISIPDGYTGPSQIALFHEMKCKESLTVPSFNNNVVYNERVSSNRGMYMLCGSARTTDGKEVATASCYVFDESSPGLIENLGFNIIRSEPRRCYNKFKLNNVSPGAKYKIHIITTTMTDADLSYPLEEVKRISLTLATRASTPCLSVSRLRSDHVLAWQALWKTQITIIPKNGITASEEASIANLNKCLRTALYNIFSCTGDNIPFEANPLGLNMIDLEGQALYEGDLWLVPILLFIKPEAARTMLDFRWASLSTAMNIAASYGLSGGKFPYTDDTLGYKVPLYYDVMTPHHIFNSALIAINAWNYYRVSYDRNWLSTKGYHILKSVADFFVSLIEIDADGSFHIRNVVGFGTRESKDNHAFTNNVVKLALKYTIEASYELSMFVKEEWRRAFFGLPVLSIDQMFNFDVIKHDADVTGADSYDIIDSLLILIPYFSQLFFCGDGLHGPTAIKKNIDYYKSRINPDFIDHPYNIAILAILNGLYSQHDPSNVDDFSYYLNRFIDVHCKSPWMSLQGVGAPHNGLNNVIMSSLFLMVIMQGIPQFNIAGGVAETRFYYEEMRLKSLMSANMPKPWSAVKMSNVGRDRKTLITRNSLFYV